MFFEKNLSPPKTCNKLSPNSCPPHVLLKKQSSKRGGYAPPFEPVLVTRPMGGCEPGVLPPLKKFFLPSFKKGKQGKGITPVSPNRRSRISSDFFSLSFYATKSAMVAIASSASGLSESGVFLIFRLLRKKLFQFP